MASTYGRLGSIEKNVLASASSSLVGIAEGLICDGELNDREIFFLRSWLEANKSLIDHWPVSIIYEKVQEVIKDNIITNEERQHLLQTLQELVGGDVEEYCFDNVTSIVPNENVIIKIPLSIFCFTGEFLFGTRQYCESIVEKKGGVTTSSLTKKVDYLIIGERPSPEWKHGSYGTKIEKAMEYKLKGVPINIVQESEWVKAL